MRKRILLSAALLLISGALSRADEGMWMVNAITRALEANMQAKGFKLSAGEVYNADAPGTALCDAIVSLDFGCTGSIISDEGLVITNHHCAYSDVHALSTPEHNYLEDGFWALYAKDEIAIPGKSAFMLKKVLDVTDEVMKEKAAAADAGAMMGMRKLSSILESRYKKSTGLEASLSSMWAGSRYYLALYEVYTDVRLVAAPPVSISAYGGDIDNWEWPQHKCDFAMYRIYTSPDGKPAAFAKDNIPMRPSRRLTISREGYSDGSFAMVIGYPGRTDRYASSAKVDYLTDVSLPITNRIRGEQMEIISGWMDRDPGIRLKYADNFFSLSNVQELQAGEQMCCKRFEVAAEKRAQEKELQEWILADPERTASWGSLLEKLSRQYKAIEDAERNRLTYRESLIRGTRLGIIAMRLSNNARSARQTEGSLKSMRTSVAREYNEMDIEVEKDLFRHAVATYYEGVDPACWGAYQKELYARHDGDAAAVAEALIAESWMTDRKRIVEFLISDDWKAYVDDPMIRFLDDRHVSEFNALVDSIEGADKVLDLSHEYTRAMYQMRLEKGVPQYPDANSTMRFTYGTVGGYEPKDGIWCNSVSHISGILQKYNPESYDFNLKPDWKELLESGSYTGPVNFLTDNDITGGNSGSPVLNDRGEIIGLAFDGNKESLAGDVSFTQQYNKCVCVDIRYVLWTLEHYGRMTRVLDEIGK